MKIALFLCSLLWTVSAAAQTSLSFVGSPNSGYRRFSATIDNSGALWDLTFLHSDAGYQGIAGARIKIQLAESFSLSPGLYAVFGGSKELFGSGYGLGWKGEWGRLETDGLIVQYINPTKSSLFPYTIGEGEVSLRLFRGLIATGGGEMVHNHPHASRKIFWGGGLGWRFEKLKSLWTISGKNRGREVQLGLSWSPEQKKKSD